MPNKPASQDSASPKLADNRRWLALIFLAMPNVVWWLTLLAGLLTVGGFLSRHSLIFELICHFRVQYAIALLCASIVLAIARQRLRVAVAALLATVNLALILPLYLPWFRSGPSTDHPANPLRVLSANVLSSNTRYRALLDLVRKERPDIVVLSEITPRWLEEIAELKRDYPQFRAVPSADNFGIALYSKFPLDDVKVWHMGRAEVPAMAVRVTRDSETITVHAIHVLPPSSGANWIDRNQALNELAAKIQTQQQPLIVVGDLNTTSWSAAFADFVAATGLYDTRVGFGVQPTFPSDRLVVRIPIDHCLVSSSISVVDRRVGPDIGSDHLPIVIDLAVIRRADDEARRPIRRTVLGFAHCRLAWKPAEPPDASLCLARMLSPVQTPTSTTAALMRLVWPVLIEQILVMLVGFSDTILAGRYLDSSHLAAMTVLSYLLWALNNLFSFISIGTTAMVARFVGAGDTEQAKRIVNQSFLIGAAWALIITTGGLLFAGRVIEWMQLEGTAVEFAVRYLRFLLPVVPFMMLESVGIASLRGAGDMVTGLVAMIVVNAVNIGVSWLLLTGAGPFPQLGWDGIAIGTSLGHVMGGLIPFVVLLRGRKGLRIEHRLLHFDGHLARRILRIGVPGGVDVLSINICQIAFLSLVNLLGAVATAAHGVAIRIESIAYLPGFAFQLATATLTGQQLGAGEPNRALRTVLVACAWNVFLMSCAGLVLYFGAEQLLVLFLGHQQPDVARLGAPLLRIIAVAMPALATLMVMTGALRGAGDTRLPLVITLIGFLGVRIPLAGLLAYGLGWGITGAWYAMVIDLVLRAALIAARFSVGAWKHVQV